MKNKMLLFLSLTAFLQLSANKQPAWNDQLDFDKIEYRLQNERVVEFMDMHTFLKKSGKVPSGTHPIKLAILESGLKAVFKKAGACYGEVAAYKAAKALGMRLVPPTVLREINGKVGSLQFYVESSIDLMRSKRDYTSKLDPKTVSDEQLFSYLLCRWDTHAGNQMLTKDGGKYYLALIDNAGVRSLIHRTKNKVRTYYASTLENLKKLDREKVKSIWSDLLCINGGRTDTLIKLILERKEHLLAAAKQAKIRTT